MLPHQRSIRINALDFQALFIEIYETKSFIKVIRAPIYWRSEAEIAASWDNSHKSKALTVVDRSYQTSTTVWEKEKIWSDWGFLTIAFAKWRNTLATASDWNRCGCIINELNEPSQKITIINQKQSTNLVGSLSLSGPLREMTNVMDPRPLIGARSLPVQKNRNFFFCSRLKECRTCHSKRIVGWPLKYLQKLLPENNNKMLS
jgi:hypothetical protein